MCRYLLFESSTQPTCVNLAEKLNCELGTFFLYENEQKHKVLKLTTKMSRNKNDKRKLVSEKSVTMS